MDTAELAGVAVPPRFAFSEEHAALRTVLADLFVDAEQTSTGWRRLLAEVGADEIVLDIGSSGTSASPVDLAILAEEAGAALFGGPVLPSLLAGALAAATGDPGWTTALRDGSATVAAMIGGQARLTGASRGTPGLGIDVDAEPVFNAVGADWVLVQGALDGSPAVALLATSDDTVRVHGLSGLDLSRPLGRVVARGAHPRMLLAGEKAVAVCAQMQRRVDLAVCAELLGVSQRALDGTVSYVSKRVQFGRTIGSFQAVKHRLVDLLALVELARSAVYGAAWGLATDPTGVQTDIDLAVAAVLARRSALEVTRAAVQLHGGIAITWEHWAHRYLRRANSLVALTGSSSVYRRRLADLVDRRDGER